MLNWVKPFNIFCFLDNHEYRLEPSQVECLLAAGSVESFSSGGNANALPLLDRFLSRPHWFFGHIGYDLKNELQNLESHHPDRLGFPDLFFFRPEILINLRGDQVSVTSTVRDPQEIYAEIEATRLPVNDREDRHGTIHNRIGREEYISIIKQLKGHILRGDCYEINFCQEFYSGNAWIDPVETYEALSAMSPNPFSALYRLRDKYLICASPERFLKREGRQILSQPMKGTRKRRGRDPLQDQEDLGVLVADQKERSENVMIVDLVRNDLSKICLEGSVHVDELFGGYSFPQVHQLVSTVSGTLNENVPFSDILRACFPMGSMTGAPKKRVMELIERYERSKRGLFSGSLGYVSPSGDFDFNVVIRSILYNSTNRYLSFQAGSGITFYSDPEKEWEECMLKAIAIKKVLGA